MKPYFLDFESEVVSIDGEGRFTCRLTSGELAGLAISGFRSLADDRPTPEYIGFPQYIRGPLCPSAQVIRLEFSTVDKILAGKSSLNIEPEPGPAPSEFPDPAGIIESRF